MAAINTLSQGEGSEWVAQQPRQVNIDLDPPNLAYNHAYDDRFQSSVFDSPQSAAGATIYVDEFPNKHRVTRLAKFEVGLAQSTDLSSFNAYLTSQQAIIQSFVDVNEALILYITKMPLWLSNSSDASTLPADSNWKVFNAHGPANYTTWRSVITAGVDFFEQFGIPIYYEVWNEPANYWLESDANFLELYKQTVQAIKLAHAAAKVGGAVLASSEAFVANNLNIQLIAYAKAQVLPLDFVSWHNYTGPVADLFTVKAAMQAACDSAGWNPTPEFMISEWNNNSVLRASEFAPAYCAEKIFQMAMSGMDLDIFTFWEDPSVTSGNGGLGLLTKTGVKKPIYYAYNFLHKLSIPDTGIAPIQMLDVRVSVTRLSSTCYRIVMWEFYGGVSISDAYQRSQYMLTFKNARSVAVTVAQSVKRAFATKEFTTIGGKLLVTMEKNEVLLLDVCLSY